MVSMKEWVGSMRNRDTYGTKMEIFPSGQEIIVPSVGHKSVDWRRKPYQSNINYFTPLLDANMMCYVS